MSAFRKQVEMAGKKESGYVIDQIPELQKNINKIVKAMSDKVASGEFGENELSALQLSLEKAEKLVEISSRLLGYDGDNGETELNLRIRGRSNFNHYLPGGNRILPEVIEEAEEVGNGD